jgi:pimeloyl-ACP methyl ester carboxylesterase
MIRYRKGSVRSADGTVIGYRELGSGPAVLLVHGGMKASQHFMKLAGALADEFTVCVPDRRGRGLSGPHGDDFSVLREVEDMQALVAATGAARIFGLSSGALVALRTALATPELDRVAMYEPPLSVNGSVPLDWTPRYDRELAAGRAASALVTALKGMRVEPVLDRFPRFVLVPLMSLAQRLQPKASADDVPIAALVPTQRFDMQVVRELAGTAKDYTALDAQVLLLGGTRSPAYLGVALDELDTVLPHATRGTLTGLDHSGPEDDGDPQRVGEALRDFFRPVRA